MAGGPARRLGVDPLEDGDDERARAVLVLPHVDLLGPVGGQAELGVGGPVLADEVEHAVDRLPARAVLADHGVVDALAHGFILAYSAKYATVGPVALAYRSGRWHSPTSPAPR